jgi:hypothetical protein
MQPLSARMLRRGKAIQKTEDAVRLESLAKEPEEGGRQPQRLSWIPNFDKSQGPQFLKEHRRSATVGLGGGSWPLLIINYDFNILAHPRLVIKLRHRTHVRPLEGLVQLSCPT